MFHVLVQSGYRNSDQFSGVVLLPHLKSVPKELLHQGHLDFGAPNFAPDAYLHSPQNERARQALDKWQSWPGGVFCLIGEAGSGKSHLGNIWAQRAGAPLILGTDLDLPFVSSLPNNHVLIDQANLCEETALFALLTNLERDGGAVLLLARDPPLQWGFDLPDLKSRLSAIVCERLPEPDTALLARLIIRKSAARGFKIDEASSTYLASRIPRTFEATGMIVGCMEEVTRPSLKSPMALAQRALQAFCKANGYDEDEDTLDLFDDET